MSKRLQPMLKYSCANRDIQNNVFLGFKNEQSLNGYISSLCKQKLFKDALGIFDILRNNADYLVYPSTYAHLISACSFLRSLEYGRKIHDHISQPDVILENHIINMYGKCGSMKDARKVFDTMKERNVVTWTALIAGYSQNGAGIEAINSYILMQRLGCLPDHFTLGNIITACSSLPDTELGKQLHSQVIKFDLGSHLIPQNALITMYVKCDLISVAYDVFCCIESKDLISWSSMICGFSKVGFEVHALGCFKDMLLQGSYRPNEFIFGSIFSMCGSLRQPEHGRQIHGLSLKYGLEGNAFTGCSLTDMYAKCGILCSAKTAFNRIKSPDMASWNAMIAGFASCGESNDAMLVFSKMRRLGLSPDEITIRSLLGALSNPCNLTQGELAHSYIVKIGLDLDIQVSNALLTLYANCSNRTYAYKVFNEIRSNANHTSWNMIIAMFMRHSQIEEVVSLFRTMLLFYGKPDHITLVNVLAACGKVAFLQIGSQVHCYAVKTGLDFDIMVVNTLIDMYVKCGSLESARKLFNSTENLDLVSWSSLIIGYAQFGDAEEALNLFRRMKNLGMKPNKVSMVGLLTACSHVGLVEEGLELFRSMEKQYDIVPTREHCSCVVDLLARGGRIHDAETFINQLPLEPDVVMWKTLLSACRTRNNIEVGRRVAEKILKLDPFNSAAHVLLCSVYASLRDWKSVATLRSCMKERGMKKIAGGSWIEVDDKMHIFLPKDGLHPERIKIYSMCDELRLQIQNLGYTPSWESSFLFRERPENHS